MSAHDSDSGKSDVAIGSELRIVVDRFRVLAARRRGTFLLVFILAAVGIQAVAFVWPGTFEARAAVLLQKTRIATGVDADPQQPTTVMTDTVSEQEVNSEVAILTSREVVDRTMRGVGLDQIPVPLYLRALMAPLRAHERAYSWFHGTPYPNAEQRARASLADSISVERLRDSNILVVSLQAGDPRFAETVLDELLRHYVDRHVAVHSQTDVQPFFTNQTDVLREAVATLQEQLATLKSSAAVSDFATEREVQMRRAAGLRDEELLVQRQIAELDGKTTAIRRSASGDESWTRMSTTTRPASQAREGLRSEMLRLELEQIRLEAKFTDTSPLVRENRAKLEAAQRALDQERQSMAEESTTGLNPTLVALRQEEARLDAERAGAANRLTALQSQLASTRERLSLLDRRTDEAERLQLQLESAKERYLLYLERAERARMDAALDTSRVANVSIVQQADAPLKPVRPTRLMTLIVSILGGLAIALLVCAWLELTAMGVAGVLDAAAPRTEETL